MKLVQFPMFNLQLRIYKGSEIQAFEKRFNVAWDTGTAGLSVENGIWIGNPTIAVCAHESDHFVRWLLSEWLNVDSVDFGEAEELTPNLVGYVTQAVWDYVSA